MANITKYLEKKLLEQSVGRITNFTLSNGVYVGLFTSAPTADYTSANPTGTEVTGGNYSRKPIQAAGWNDAQDNNDVTYSSKITNKNDIEWTGINANWGTIGYVGIFDAGTTSPPTGNLLWFGPLSTPITIAANDTFTISSGNITLTLG